jgi:DNA-directed RNA polymerase subunit E'/Rpb7
LESYSTSHKGKCTRSYGYILDVISIVKIISNFISRVDFNIIFQVEFEIIGYIPSVGDIHNCEIFLVFKEGIFAKIQNLKIFIHSNKFPNLEFDYINSTFACDDNSISLGIGSNVTVEILGVKYKDQNFSCFGTII